MIKILHCADLHLDTPFSRDGTQRRLELRSAFCDMLDYVRKNDIEFVLISGDLYEDGYIMRETSELLCRETASCPNTFFVIAPGNHDPYTDTSVYARCVFADNVNIFNSEDISYFSYTAKDGTIVNIFGWAFTSPEMKSCPLSQQYKLPENSLNILCAHGDATSPISHKCPITRADIGNSGFDYIALGHIHNGTLPEKIGNTYWAYSGCFSARDFGECGIKGALELHMNKTFNDNTIDISHRFLRFSQKRYEIIRADASGMSDKNVLAAQLKDIVRQNSYGDDTALRVITEGSVTADFSISQRFIAEQLDGLWYTELIDRTLPMYDNDALANDPTIRGAFYNSLLPMLENGTIAEKATAARALRIGLTVLGGGEI